MGSDFLFFLGMAFMLLDSLHLCLFLLPLAVYVPLPLSLTFSFFARHFLVNKSMLAKLMGLVKCLML